MRQRKEPGRLDLLRSETRSVLRHALHTHTYQTHHLPDDQAIGISNSTVL